MSIDQRRIRFFRVAGALIPLLTILLGLGAARAAAAPAGTYYAMPTVSAIPNVCAALNCDVASGLIGYEYDGEGSCLACAPADPFRAGTFSFSLVAERYYPIDPLRVKSGSGTLEVIWADSTSTLVTYKFKARDSKALSLTGQVTGGTSSRFAVGTFAGGLVGLPPNPVEPAVTAGAFWFD
jgi:hypothetical protein